MDLPLRISIGYNKNIVVKKNAQYLNVYINDNVYENKKLVPEKSNSVWLKWAEMLKLRDAINSIEEQIVCSTEFGDNSNPTVAGAKAVTDTSQNTKAYNSRGHRHQPY